MYDPGVLSTYLPLSEEYIAFRDVILPGEYVSETYFFILNLSKVGAPLTGGPLNKSELHQLPIRDKIGNTIQVNYIFSINGDPEVKSTRKQLFYKFAGLVQT